MSLLSDVLHLLFYRGEFFYDFPELWIFNDQQMALAIDDCRTITSKFLINLDHHLHFPEVATFHIHVERYVPRDTFALGYIVTELDAAFHDEKDFFGMVTLCIKNIFGIHRHRPQSC